MGSCRAPGPFQLEEPGGARQLSGSQGRRMSRGRVAKPEGPSGGGPVALGAPSLPPIV